MTKIMIVDDEFLVRAGLKASINWRKYGFDITGDFENGRKALEFAQFNCPDIVLTDVVMPEMDGLELIKELKKIKENIRFIILTSYEEFKYAQEALRLGADDYILKLSLNVDELLKVLLKIKKEMNSEINSAVSKSNVEAGAFQILLGEYIESVEDSYPCLVEGNKRLIYLSIDNYELLPIEKQLENNMYIINGIKSIVMNLVSRSIFAEIDYVYRGSYAIILKTNERVSSLMELAKKIQQSIWMYFNLRVSVFISNAFQDITQFKTVLKKCRSGIAYKFYSGEKAIITEERTLNEFTDNLRDQYFKVNEKLESAISFNDFDTVSAVVNDLYNYACSAKSSPESVKDVYTNIYFLLEGYFRDSINPSLVEDIRNPLFIIKNSEFLQDLHAVLKNIVQNMSVYVKETNSTLKREVYEAVEYIKANYAKDISLEMLAKRYNMNSSYFSRLLKEKTGENFTDLVMRLRINKAKELLSGKEEIYMYEISNMVGYDDFSHFARMFKKYTGMTPKEYRHSLFKKKK